MPPHRFEDVRFESYLPDAGFPTQQAALDRLHELARTIDSPRPSRWRRPKKQQIKAAVYIDGGFGTGKTHLLASLWHASPGPKAYVTFTELTALIGFSGMPATVEAFSSHRLLCIDEFELDDVANTLMVVSFLRNVMPSGLRLAVTSNTLPDRLGEQRFSAADFRREISAIASYFDEMPVDGPDYRLAHRPLPLFEHLDSELTTVSRDDFWSLIAHLRRIHPVQYGPLLDEIDGVAITDIEPIRDQDAALLFVQFVDKLYDARIPVFLAGCDSRDLFDPSFRNGGYRKKYGRAESRVTAMRSESEGLLER